MPPAEMSWWLTARPARMPNSAPATVATLICAIQAHPVVDRPMSDANCGMKPMICRMMPSTTPPAMPPTTPAPVRLITLDGDTYSLIDDRSLRGTPCGYACTVERGGPPASERGSADRPGSYRYLWSERQLRAFC